MKRILGFRAIGMFGVSLAILVAPGLAAPPTVVVGLKSIDELLDDVEFIGSAADRNGLRAAAEVGINALTRGMGLAGVDREKPMGVYWNMTTPAPNDIGKTVAFIPVSDVKEFKKLVTLFLPDFKDTDGRWTMTAGSMPLFAGMINDYCFVSPSVEALANLPDPNALVNSKYDVAIDVSLSAIPNEAKAFFLKATEDGGRKSLAERPPPKNDAERIGQQIGFDGFLSAFKAVANDGDRVTFGLNVDSETRLASIDFGLTSKPNTALAHALSGYGKTTPAFAVVGPDDAPLRLVLSHPVAMTADTSKQIFDAMRKSAESDVDKDEKLPTDARKKAAKDLAKRALDVMKATVDSGSLHSVIVIDEGAGETVRVVTGTRIAKGDDAGKLVDDLVKLSKEGPDYANVKLDVAKHAGARIHAITPKADKKLTDMFGDGPIHLAIRPDSIWISLGGGNLESLKSALDQSGKRASKTDVPISLRVKPATLVELLEDDNKALIQRAEALAGEPGDVLNVEIAPIEGNGIKLHVVFGVDLIKLGANQ